MTQQHYNYIYAKKTVYAVFPDAQCAHILTQHNTAFNTALHIPRLQCLIQSTLLTQENYLGTTTRQFNSKHNNQSNVITLDSCTTIQHSSNHTHNKNMNRITLSETGTEITLKESQHVCFLILGRIIVNYSAPSHSKSAMARASLSTRAGTAADFLRVPVICSGGIYSQENSEMPTKTTELHGYLSVNNTQVTKKRSV